MFWELEFQVNAIRAIGDDIGSGGARSYVFE